MSDTAPGYAAQLFANYAGKPTVEVELHGARHAVPAGVTVLMALWYAGFDTVHGAGCLGGACGACTFSYRLPDGPATHTGLACQVAVQDGMAVTLLPIDPPRKPLYRMAEIDDPAEALFTIYPETRRCTNCDACTVVCPQDIPVRQTVRQMMNKDFAPVAPAFDECVSCGLCTMVCEVAIAPNLLGLYARKAVAGADPAPPELVRGMDAVREGRLGPAWEDLLGQPENTLESMSSEDLAERCRAAWERAAAR